MNLLSLNELKSHFPVLVALAQSQYDQWSQDESGHDELVGYGGICHLIAEDLSAHLNTMGFESCTYSLDTEVHVVTIVALKEGVYELDIPYRIYEIGGGYTWTKKIGVVFSSEDIVLSLIDKNPEAFNSFIA